MRVIDRVDQIFNSTVTIAPSILSADFGDIKGALNSIQASGAEWVHCDIMDGLFVPNISFGAKMVSDIRQNTQLVLDVHMMVVDPIRYIESFYKAGADIITVHVEACKDKSIVDTLLAIKQLGVKAGAVVSPNTSVELYRQCIDYCDMALLMSVYPGFSGQKFIEKSLGRLLELKAIVGKKDIPIEIDGGITVDNCKQVIDNGASVLVCGNTFFNAIDKVKIVSQLRGIST